VGEGAVVRSDDIDGSGVLGEVTQGGRTWQFRVTCDDDGHVLASDLTEV